MRGHQAAEGIVQNEAAKALGGERSNTHATDNASKAQHRPKQSHGKGAREAAGDSKHTSDVILISKGRRGYTGRGE